MTSLFNPTPLYKREQQGFRRITFVHFCVFLENIPEKQLSKHNDL